MNKETRHNLASKPNSNNDRHNCLRMPSNKELRNQRRANPKSSRRCGNRLWAALSFVTFLFAVEKKSKLALCTTTRVPVKSEIAPSLAMTNKRTNPNRSANINHTGHPTRKTSGDQLTRSGDLKHLKPSPINHNTHSCHMKIINKNHENRVTHHPTTQHFFAPLNTQHENPRHCAFA